MIIALATVSGFQNGIKNKVLGTNGHVVVDNISNVEGSVPAPLSKQMESYAKDMKKLPHVASVNICLMRPCIAKGETEIEGMVAKGVDDHYDFTYFRNQLVAGKLPDFKKDSNQILISSVTAARLNLKAGERFTGLFFKQDSFGNQKIKAMNPVIAGIFNTGLDEFDKTVVITSRRVLKRMVDGNETFTQFEIRVDDYTNAPSVAYEIQQLLPAGKFNVNTAERFNRQIFDWLHLLDTNVIIILVLMILVACINMSTTLLILITERTQMVGTLKSLGAKNKGITSIFLFHAIFIALIGLVIGNIIGIGFCYFQEKYQFMKLNVETYYVDHVLVEMQPWHIPAVNIGTLIICVLVLLLPSLVINRLTPVKSMRFQ
ncbi:MAG: ABC transporter permease [Bacteroidetes bacterium]|nr:ABC transporter permease [Bacteroidota bacterium]